MSNTDPIASSSNTITASSSNSQSSDTSLLATTTIETLLNTTVAQHRGILNQLFFTNYRMPNHHRLFRMGGFVYNYTSYLLASSKL